MAGNRPGPAAKREAERIRPHPPAGGDAKHLGEDEFSQYDFPIELVVEPPESDPEWHSVARMLYEAILRDPARTWMGPADWALSYLMCENISRQLKPQAIGIVDGGYDPEVGENVVGHVAREVVPLKGTDVTGILRWATNIGVTEAARLALRKEVNFNERPKPKAVTGGDVVDIRPQGWFQEPKA